MTLSLHSEKETKKIRKIKFCTKMNLKKKLKGLKSDNVESRRSIFLKTIVLVKLVEVGVSWPNHSR